MDLVLPAGWCDLPFVETHSDIVHGHHVFAWPPAFEAHDLFMSGVDSLLRQAYLVF